MRHRVRVSKNSQPPDGIEQKLPNRAPTGVRLKVGVAATILYMPRQIMVIMTMMVMMMIFVMVIFTVVISQVVMYVFTPIVVVATFLIAVSSASFYTALARGR